MSALPSYVRIMREGFAEQRGKGSLVRSQMESGPPKQRRVATRTMVTRPVLLRIDTKTNYLAFVAWVETDLNGGADWFTFTDPVDGVSKSGRFVGGEYTGTPRGSTEYWTVAATLETWG